MHVIGVAGQAGFGKDLLSDRLKERLGSGWGRTAFASNVKKIYCETFNVDTSFVEQWKVVSDPPSGFDMPVRQSLQFIGDGFRKISHNIWVDLVFRNKNNPIIISDVRYVNEFRRVKKEGGLNILLGRPDKLNNDPNRSESEIRPYIDWCLTNLKGDNFFVLDNYAEQIDNAVIPSKSWLRKNPMFWRKKTTSSESFRENLKCFDVFIRNDRSKEDFFNIIDKQLTTYVQNYQFLVKDLVFTS